jgi:hypothetical protein
MGEKDDTLLPGRFLTDQIGQVDMVSRNGEDYRMQLYFDMSTGTLKASNQRDAWDLALGCDMSKPNAFVNPAMTLAIAATGSTNFTQNYFPSDYEFRYERSNRFFTRGWMSEDMQNGTSGRQVYLVDMGRTINNQNRGYKKIQIVSLDDKGYDLKISDLDNSGLLETRIEVDGNYNHLYISLEKPDSVMQLEPPRNEWDLHFTEYMERLFDGSDTLDYSVTGCLINPYRTQAYFDTISSLDSSVGYTSLRLEDVDETRLTSRQDVIGHDWKYFDLDAGAFLVRTNWNYFVRDNGGATYRMRFTGFYDNSGNKGAVSFEYLPL